MHCRTKVTPVVIKTYPAVVYVAYGSAFLFRSVLKDGCVFITYALNTALPTVKNASANPGRPSNAKHIVPALQGVHTTL